MKEKMDFAMLSEFSRFERIRSLISSGDAHLFIYFSTLALGVVACALASLSGSDCIVLALNERVLTFGYFAELQHGLFAVTVGPVFLALSIWIAQIASSSLVALANNGTLVYVENGVVVPTQARTVEELSKANSAFFGPFLAIAVSIAAVSIAIPESLSFDAAHFGWVQAVFADEWNDTTLAALDFDESPAIVAGVTPDQVRVEHRSGGSTRPNQRHWLFFFLLTSLGYQAIFVIVSCWSVGKSSYVYWRLHRAVRASRNCPDSFEGYTGFAARINCCADDERFGLAAFDRVYSITLFVANVGSTTYFFRTLSNVEKGTVGGLAFVGQWATYLLPLSMFALTIVIPAVLLRTDLFYLQKRFADLGNVCPDPKKEQTPWPSKSIWFKSNIVVGFFLLIAMPIALSVNSAKIRDAILTDRETDAFTVMRWVQHDGAAEICHAFHPAAGGSSGPPAATPASVKP